MSFQTWWPDVRYFKATSSRGKFETMLPVQISLATFARPKVINFFTTSAIYIVATAIKCPVARFRIFSIALVDQTVSSFPNLKFFLRNSIHPIEIATQTTN